MKTGDRPAPRQPLHAEFALVHEEGACLPLRSTYGQCRACADACPVDALTVNVSGLVLSDTCTGCGRCTAACPTQALSLPEMAMLVDPVWPAEPEAAVHVECRKVPREAYFGETLVVPCLGALTPGHLLARAAAGCDVAVVDRGWCEGCTSGFNREGDAHPAHHAVEVATLWLASVGSPRRPVFVAAPLARERRPQAIPPAPTEAPAIDRRRFFRAAIEKPAGRQRSTDTAIGGDGRAAYPADARHASPERERQRRALLRITQAQGTAMPAEFFPQLHADARCCDRRMCVALCPTAALTAADEGAASRLRLDADRCIACGTCVRACPESALTLAAHGGRAGVYTLASHPRARCPECGDGFRPAAGPDHAGAPALCPDCTKSRRFMTDARRQLFGALN
jgi:ferredoxin